MDGDLIYEKVTATDRRRYVATFCVASALTFVSLGVVLATLGRLQLSRIVEYLPSPVTAGMLASIGVSLAKSGARVAAFGGWRVDPGLGIALFGLATSCAVISRLLKRHPCFPTFLAQPVVVAIATIGARQAATILGLEKCDQQRLGLLFHWDDQMLKTARGWFAWTDIGTVGTTHETAEAAKKDINVEPIFSHFIWHVLFASDSNSTTVYHSWRRFAKVRLWRRGIKRLLTHIDWGVVFECRGVALCAVVVMTMKIAMKTGSLAALFPIADVAVDDELQRLGVAGNVVPACAALAAGQAYSFSSLRIAQQFGASDRGAGVMMAIFSLATWLTGFGVLSVVPRFVYGALLMDLGYDYLETYLVAPFAKSFKQRKNEIKAAKTPPATTKPQTSPRLQRHNHESTTTPEHHHLSFNNYDHHHEKTSKPKASYPTRSAPDLATIIIIVFVALISSLLEAVSVGLILCLFFTATRLAAVSVIATNETAATARSTIERSARQNAALDESGDSIAVIAVRGLLFFGSASELLDVIRRLPLKTQHLVLDVARCVQTYDATAVAAFDQIIEIGKHRGFDVAIAPDPPALVDRLAEKCLFFMDPDDALEHAEDALLTTLLPPTPLVSRRGARKAYRPRRKRTPSKSSLEEEEENSPPPPPPMLPVIGQTPPMTVPSVGRLLRSWLAAAADDGGSTAFVDDVVASALLDTGSLRAFGCSASQVIYRRGQSVDAPAFTLICAGRFRLTTSGDRCVRKLTPGHAVSVGAFYFYQRKRRRRSEASSTDYDDDDDYDDSRSGGSDCASSPTSLSTTRRPSAKYLIVPGPSLPVRRTHTLTSTVAHSIILEVPYDAVAKLEIDEPAAALEFHKLMARTLATKNRNSLLARLSIATDDAPVHHPFHLH